MLETTPNNHEQALGHKQPVDLPTCTRPRTKYSSLSIWLATLNSPGNSGTSLSSGYKFILRLCGISQRYFSPSRISLLILSILGTRVAIKNIKVKLETPVTFSEPIMTPYLHNYSVTNKLLAKVPARVSSWIPLTSLQHHGAINQTHPTELPRDTPGFSHALLAAASTSI